VRVGMSEAHWSRDMSGTDLTSLRKGGKWKFLGWAESPPAEIAYGGTIVEREYIHGLYWYPP